MGGIQTVHECRDTWRRTRVGGWYGALGAYIAWVETGACLIRDKTQRLRPLAFNRSQCAVLAVMIGQAADLRPVRISILKSRKTGISTLIQTLYSFVAAHYPRQIAVTLAHLPESTDEIADIAKRAARPWPRGADVQARRILYPDVDSRLWYHTAGGASVAVAGTPSMMHLSEVALWKLNKADTYATSIEAVPYEPTTCIVEESTARGRELFYAKWEAAHDPRHPYAAVFIPWFFDEALHAEGEFDAMLDDDERALCARAQRYGVTLTDGMLLWRRRKLLDIGPIMFKREYPATPQEAVESAKGMVLPSLFDCLIPDDKLPFLYGSTVPADRVGGIDFGHADPTAILSAVIHDDTLYVTGLWHGTQTVAADQVEGLLSGHRYYCDPAGLQARVELQRLVKREQAVALLAAPRALGDRQVDFVTAEWHQVEKLAREGRLKIVESCADQIMLEADNLFWHPTTGQPDMRRGEQWFHFDSLDALRYCVMGFVRGREAMRPINIPVQPAARRERWRNW